MRQVTYSREAARSLKRMPANVATAIMAKIEKYVADPASLAQNLKTLKGRRGESRLRVGDWRVILRDKEGVVEVLTIGPRGSVYD